MSELQDITTTENIDRANAAKNLRATVSQSGEVRKVSLSLLQPFALNPRQDIAQSDVRGLARSILTMGQLHDLTVRQNDGKLDVIAGGRRLKAFHLLVENGLIDMNYQVKVDDRGELSDAEALILSAAENLEREDMNPADECLVFLTLRQMGLADNEISARYGCSEKLVRGRLAIAELGTDVLTALRNKDLTLFGARVIASAPENLRHYAYEQIVQNGNTPESVAVLLRDRNMDIPVETALFDVQAYSDAKGVIKSDLFGLLGERFTNRELFFRLQEEAAQAHAEGYRQNLAFAVVQIGTEMPSGYSGVTGLSTLPDQSDVYGAVINIDPSSGAASVFPAVRTEAPEVPAQAGATKGAGTARKTSGVMAMAPTGPAPSSDLVVPDISVTYLHQYRSETVRRALVSTEQGPRAAKALLILRLLKDSNGLEVKYSESQETTKYPTKRTTPYAEEIRGELNAFFDERGLKGAKADMIEGVAMFRALIDLADADLDRLLAKVVALGIREHHARTNLLLTEVLWETGVATTDKRAHYELDAGYLEGFNKAGLIKLASTMPEKVNVTPSMKNAEIIARLLEVKEKLAEAGWMPPEFSYGQRLDLNAEQRARQEEETRVRAEREAGRLAELQVQANNVLVFMDGHDTAAYKVFAQFKGLVDGGNLDAAIKLAASQEMVDATGEVRAAAIGNVSVNQEALIAAYEAIESKLSGERPQVIAAFIGAVENGEFAAAMTALCDATFLRTCAEAGVSLPGAARAA